MLARLPRWTWLLVLPMLVGALLLMHGLAAQAGDSHHSAASASAPAPAPAGVVDVHVETGSAPGDHGHCGDCLAGHVMAACVAIISALGGVGLVRRLLARGTLAVPVDVVAGRVRRLVELARPPDPVWVRLSVMRC